MDLHVIGGFLGSGKTTAIINAVKIAVAQGQRVGVITNDKGRFLVDSAFIGAIDTESSHIRTAEVRGGCFRCNYQDFQERITQIQEEGPLDVLFAESVGSCVDLVGPVLMPLSSKFGSDGIRVTYSVFVDIRLLYRYLAGLDLPFSENITYIFKKQIEEGSIIVINKSDLFPKQAQSIVAEAQYRFPDKLFLLQNSLSKEGVAPWLGVLEQTQTLPIPLVLDYEPYITGAAELAWFDEKIIVSPQKGQERASILRLISEILQRLRQTGNPVAHVKFFIQDHSTNVKLSFMTLDEAQYREDMPAEMHGPITVILNARVQMDAEQLRLLIQGALHKTLTEWHVYYVATSGISTAPVVPLKLRHRTTHPG